MSTATVDRPTTPPQRLSPPPVPPADEAAPETAERKPRRSLAQRVLIGCAAFLVIVPSALVSFLLVEASRTTYSGTDGSNCQITGYPTNIDTCMGKR